MAQAKLDSRDADLSTCPQPVQHDDDITHISIGDLHGNTMKLIFTLIQEGFLTLENPEDYQDLYDIYSAPKELLSADLLEIFKDILQKATCNNARALTLLGDDLADRGNNDYFTLLVYRKLRQSSVNVDVILSNHSAEFLRDYSRPNFTGAANMPNHFIQSLPNMQWLMESHPPDFDPPLVDEAEVRQIVEEDYLPMVKAIGYTLSPDGKGINLFTHAPVGLETIEAIAKVYNIPYKEGSVAELVHTIDTINRVMGEELRNKTLLNRVANEGHHNQSVPITQPLSRLIWNREFQADIRVKPKGDFTVNFVHGHVGPGTWPDEVISHTNTDTLFAKGTHLEQTGVNGVTHLVRSSKDALQLRDVDIAAYITKEDDPTKYYRTAIKTAILVHRPTIQLDPKIISLVDELNRYIKVHHGKKNKWFGRYSETEKVTAAHDLMEKLLKEEPFDPRDLTGVYREGDLGKIIRKAENEEIPLFQRDNNLHS